MNATAPQHTFAEYGDYRRIALERCTSADQAFVAADDTAYAVQFHHDSPREKTHDGDSRTADRLLAQFETMWMNAVNGPNGARLGL